MMRAALIPMLALVLLAPAAEAADLVVVDARGGGFRPGQRVRDDQPILLKDGERVTLIGQDGRTFKLTGPSDKTPAADSAGEGTSILAAFEALRTNKEARLTQAGVIRDAGGPALPSPWLSDIRRSGDVCLKRGAAIALWRSDARSAVTVVLSPADRSWTARARWEPGEDRIVVPPLFPLRDRGAYVVKAGDAESAITLNIIPPVVASERMQAAWMLEKGCVAQAEALIGSLR